MLKRFQYLIFFILSIQHAYADMDGRWQLIITGSDQLEYGTEFLAGGVTIPWQTILEFNIKNSRFDKGTGTARLLPDMTTHSRPEGMFDCQQEPGIFASNSGQSFTMPHLRYQAFPMLGEVKERNILLKPYLDYPGNYFAVLYECSTNDGRGSVWIERSPRIARELGKRQNSQSVIKDGIYSVNIKEVKNIPPGPELSFPLEDGYELMLTDEYGARKLHYHLTRIGDE